MKAATTRRTSRQWMTVQEILDELGIPRRTWQRWRELGRAPRCTKLPNGELRIRRTDYEAWLASLEVGAA
jgi:predicted site-specific integrase-resolvase